MKLLFLLLLPIVFANSALSQNLEGEWSGYFLSVPDSTKIDFSIKFIREKGRIMAFTRSDFKQNTRSLYSICKANVSIDSSQNRIIVTEYESVKGNIPPGIECFQEHILWYTVNPKNELLTGSWKAAENRNCGGGSTTLQRKNRKSTVNQY